MYTHEVLKKGSATNTQHPTTSTALLVLHLLNRSVLALRDRAGLSSDLGTGRLGSILHGLRDRDLLRRERMDFVV